MRKSLKSMLKKLSCKKCGYSWTSLIDKPKCCPNCKSYRWDYGKRQKIRMGL